jgi:hypothetical protein
MLSSELDNNSTARHHVYAVITQESSEDLDSAENPLVNPEDLTRSRGERHDQADVGVFPAGGATRALGASSGVISLVPQKHGAWPHGLWGTS